MLYFTHALKTPTYPTTHHTITAGLRGELTSKQSDTLVDRARRGHHIHPVQFLLCTQIDQAIQNIEDTCLREGLPLEHIDMYPRSEPDESDPDKDIVDVAYILYNHLVSNQEMSRKRITILNCSDNTRGLRVAAEMMLLNTHPRSTPLNLILLAHPDALSCDAVAALRLGIDIAGTVKQMTSD